LEVPVGTGSVHLTKKSVSPRGGKRIFLNKKCELYLYLAAGVLYKAGDKLLFHPEQPPHSRLKKKVFFSAKNLLREDFLIKFFISGSLFLVLHSLIFRLKTYSSKLGMNL
jgi:hypothetical protein